jgi:hypothetical protein
MNETMIPISMFLGLTIILCVLFWFRYKSREAMQQTFRAALEKGQELTPEIIDRLGHPKAPKDKDLRLGILWVALAIGLVCFGLGIPDEDEVARIFAGIAAFPLMIGVAYLILHKFTDRE